VVARAAKDDKLRAQIVAAQQQLLNVKT